LAIGRLPALPDTLPASCGGVGAKSYTPPVVTIPAVTLNLGTVITVTNASVAMNGDTSSVAALNANPGPDGISIAEAIQATNNDPGTWNIQFAPALKGSSIVVDSGFAKGLPFLTGGNVTINGDIDGDGQPDITLTSISGTDTGFFVLSGGNTLYGLALQNFTYGVWISPPGAFQPGAAPGTLSNIAIGNLVMTNIQFMGIGVNPPSPASAANQSTLDHVLITGNTITGNAAGPVLGIDLELGSTAGATLQHITIANNNVTIPMTNGGGIALNVGAGIGSTKNQALDTLIANNTISGATPQFGIRIGLGLDSASGNLIDGVQVIANHVSTTRPPPPPTNPFPAVAGIIVANGDGASDDLHPPVLPIQYSENNTLRNIGILSNTIEGATNFGIVLQVACCGNANNVINALSILGNTMTGVFGNAVLLESGSSGGYYSRPTTGNELSNVLVQANSIQMTPLIYPGCNCYPGGAGVSLGGIEVWAGWREPENRIDGISIANNEVDTGLVGIAIIGGWGGGGEPNAPPSPADRNVVSAAQISCNQLDQTPTLGLDFPGIQGIDVIAGLLAASGNQVQQLTVYDNLVAGVLGDASLFANLGSGASGNTISITQISGPANGPQFTAAGLVNAASIQQRALAPGSLVSLFGSNLAGSATGGTTVQFGSISAPIIFASASQLNLQVPWELKGQSTSMVTVTANSVTSAPQSVPVGVADPGIFSLGVPQGGQGAITNAAGVVVDANSPAHAGDYLQIFATGLGTVTNTPQTGAAAAGSPLSYVINYPTATIGGVKAPVSFAGLSPGFIGLYQVNVRVPQGTATGDAIPVLLSIGSLTSNAVVISVR
jgi:uncharacterized protein (TIGR03437 family)